MLFNSIDFAIFLPVVFFLYWFVTQRSLRLQNAFIVAASLLFYGWWDWRFLFLLLFTVSMDFTISRALSRQDNPAKRKLLVTCSLVSNLTILGFFKYFNFFVANFQAAFTFFGHPLSLPSLHIVLPVGISFYTFQSLSYTLDVYRRDLEATRDPIAFLAFVSFFPQLVAGPIERASNLLPQFYRPRSFSYPAAVDGLRQILWGLFKKMVIADNCAEHVNLLFANPSAHPGSMLALGAFFFAFQIYGDFSGYSDIAIGTARLFGFRLMRNFAYPYFSRDIAEFWRRWHISLSTWFRDYLYVPLGGSRGGTAMKVRNTFAIFLVSGFWHGANWTFLAWGAVNALYFLPLLLLKRNRQNTGPIAPGRWLPRPMEFVQISATFFMTLLAWIFFRADSLYVAWHYLARLFSPALFHRPEVLPMDVLTLIGLAVAVEWIQREQPHALHLDSRTFPRPLRWGAYYALLLLLFYFGGDQQQFIYFQF